MWLLGSLAVLSLLYRTPTPALGPAADAEDQELGSDGRMSSFVGPLVMAWPR